MKKIKLMLLSFIILGVIGAALAFNAKSIINLCTTTSNGAVSSFCTERIDLALTCPIIAPGKPGISGIHPLYCYAIDDDEVYNCKDQSGAWLRCLGVPKALTTID